MEPKSNDNARDLQGYRLGALLCFYGLIIFFAISAYLALPSPSFSILVIWLIQIIPLLLFAPGLHLNIMRSNIWLSIVSLLYFTHGVLVAFDPERTLAGLIEISLCIGLFSCLTFLVKRHQDHNKITT
jgi:uncharacterized membrane protein